MSNETTLPTIPELLARLQALEKWKATFTDPNALLKKEDVMAHLQLSKRELNRLMQNRAIPYLKLGHSTVRFRRADVDARLNETRLVKAGIRHCQNPPRKTGTNRDKSSSKPSRPPTNDISTNEPNPQ